MIQEAINFVKEVEGDQTESQNEQEGWKGKKFIIINTEESSNKLKYKDFEILKNNEEINKWLRDNPHYIPLITNLEWYIPKGKTLQNKAIGSKGGLLSFSLVAFQLKGFNKETFKVKIKKTKFKKEFQNYENSLKLKEFLEIYNSFNSDQKISMEDYKNYYVLIKISPASLDYIIENNNSFIKDNFGSGDEVNGICIGCNEKDKKLLIPDFMTSYDSKKSFLLHKTKLSINKAGSSICLCKECIYFLNRFMFLINKYQLKIFPLFVDSTFQEEIKLIKQSNSGEFNTFQYIMEQLEQRDKLKEKLDFYLFVKSGDYFFFDYITNYQWKIGKIKNFFDSEGKPYQEINRFYIQQELTKILNIEFIDYFGGKIKGKDNQLTSLIYSFRQKIFDFVYRNKNSLSIRDIVKIILFRINKEISENRVKIDNENYKDDIREILNFYLNNHILEGNKMDEKSIILNKVKEMRAILTSSTIEDLEKFEIRDKEEWAYWVGQMAYFLIDKSKTENKTYGLLEPFINRSTTNLVKITLQEIYEKYKHAINIPNNRFRIILKNVLDYPINDSFIDLKIFFYIGVFDYPIIYEKINKEAE